MSVCKFCGSEIPDYLAEDGDVYCSEECEERDVLVTRLESAEARLARFDAMFPTVMPDDPGPITGAVCHALGMECQAASGVVMYKIGVSDISVDMIGNDPARVYVQGSKGLPWCTTAGQLALLVAARKAVRNDAG